MDAHGWNGPVDHLRFFNGYLTYALYTTERGRVRLEGGASSAFAPDLIVVSPSLGMSMGLALNELFTVEALIRASIRPHAQVEISAGMSVALGSVGLRVGYRHAWWEVAVDALNLFDADDDDIAYYYTSRLEGEPAAGVDDRHVHPNEPFQIRVGLTAHY